MIPSLRRERWPLARLLSLGVLAIQICIPWSVKHLATQDGPAHVYTAFVAKDLVFHRHTSPYHNVYRVQKTALPNWTCTLLLASFMAVFGPSRAEAFLMTVCLLAGYFSFAYCVRAIAPRASPWSPVGNSILQSWFLWSGFYNFYLGMMLLPLAIGYYVRHASAFHWRKALKLAAGLIAIFFTHLIPAVLAALSLLIMSAWLRRGWRQFGWLVAALVPAMALVAAYTAKSKDPAKFEPGIRAAFESFPQGIFNFSAGRVGEQLLLWPALLFLGVAAFAVMRRREWKSAKGGLAATVAAVFALYLLTPDYGFGGSAVKVRFAWAVLLFGGLLICTVDRLRRFQTAMNLYVAFFLLCQLTIVAYQVRATSDALEDYLTAMDAIPENSRFVRMNYPAPAMAHRFQMDRLAFNPLLHADAVGAVRRHAVALSDYQSATGTFPVDFKPSIGDGQRYTLWGMENPGADGAKNFAWLRDNLPVKIDYVVLVGENAPPPSSSTLEAVNRGAPFVKLYKLR